MVLISESGPQTLPIGSDGPDFELPAVSGDTVSLETFADKKALVLIFTCNHCPYAMAYEDRLIELAREYQSKGIGFLAICANDEDTYPDDSFENMKKRAEEKGFPFDYAQDKTQEVAKAYGAVCTPHIFVLDGGRKLVYEGRVDDNWKEPEKAEAHDLRDALQAIAEGEPVPQAQTNPLGCSIKWKA